MKVKNGRNQEGFAALINDELYFNRYINQLKSIIESAVTWDVSLLTTELLEPVMRWLMGQVESPHQLCSVLWQEEFNATATRGLITGLKTFEQTQSLSGKCEIIQLRKHLICSIRTELYKKTCVVARLLKHLMDTDRFLENELWLWLVEAQTLAQIDELLYDDKKAFFYKRLIEQLREVIVAKASWDASLLTTELLESVIRALFRQVESAYRTYPEVKIEELHAAASIGLWNGFKTFSRSEYMDNVYQIHPLITVTRLRQYLIAYIQIEIQKVINHMIQYTPHLKQIKHSINSSHDHDLMTLISGYVVDDLQIRERELSGSCLQEESIFKSPLSAEQREVWMLLNENQGIQDICDLTGFSRHKVSQILKALENKMRTTEV